MFSNWHKALSLEERAVLLGGTASRRGTVDGADSERKLDLDGVFASRCRALGFQPELWTELAAELEGRSASVPVWVERIATAYVDRSPVVRTEAAADKLAQSILEEVPLLRWVEPLVHDARRRLEQAVACCGAGEHLATSAIDQLTEQLLQQLRFLVSRTLVLELNILRHLELLEGENSQERYQDFVGRLTTGEYALEIANQYPNLPRAVDLRIEQWLASSGELAARLAADYTALETFAERLQPPGAKPLGAVTSIQLGLGDRHDNGRTVSTVEFASGLRLIYKPRSVAAEASFSKLLAWLEQTKFPLALEAVGVLERPSHGWVEFVDARDCSTRGELELFFERLGALIGLLYVLEATDMHYENLIARGEHPVLVDLETLFQPIVGDPQPTVEQQRAATANVLRSGLLPRRLWPNVAAAGFDLSGMSTGDSAPIEVEQLHDSASDEARYAPSAYEPEQRANMPRLDGEIPRPGDFEQQVVAGFDAMYSHLLGHRDELAADNGPLSQFRSMPVRVIVRATDIYAQLLRAAFHPDFLQDGLDRDRLFDRLWIDGSHVPEFLRTTEYEIRALKRCDVPRFFAEPQSRHLWTDDGERFDDLLHQSSWSLVQERLEALGTADRELQIWLIRASLQATRQRADNPLPGADGPAQELRSRELPSSEAPTASLDARRTLSTAVDVADHLSALAVDRGPWLNWFQTIPGTEIPWRVDVLGPNLYDGLTGVALFYAQLARLADDAGYLATARKCLGNARAWYDSESFRPRGMGAFEGLGSWIYSLTYLGALWDDEELLAEAVRAVDALPPLIEADEIFDVIAGSAGCLAVLLELERLRPEDSIRSAADLCARHLTAHAEQTAETAWWRLPEAVATTPLTGFAHGASGIAWALMRYGDRRRDRRAARLAAKAVRFERESFHREQSGWVDLRQDRQAPDGSPNAPFAWCHGAPGIGLARAGMLRCSRALELVDDPSGFEARLVADLRDAVALTAEHGLADGDSLCHGTLGNVELFERAQALAAVAADAEQMARWRENAGRRVEQRLRSKEFRCGLSLSVEQPGMMLGLAGLGYGLLRLLDPVGVPSVLMLSCPMRSGGGDEH